MKFDDFFNDDATNHYAKIGIYGDAGAGKTYTATQIAVSMYEYFKLDKPVAFFDTETGYSWIKKFFDKKSIKSGVKTSRSFSDLMNAVDIAENNCSILIVDSISHVWSELCHAFLLKFNELRIKSGKQPVKQIEFQNWTVIKEEWAKFTNRFLTSNIHIIICGRAGDQYTHERNDNGKMEIMKTGTKMATEKQLSYEPDLLIEMVKDVDITTGTYRNVAIVEKDRSDNYQGSRILYPKFNSFIKHFEEITGKGDITKFEGSSKEIFKESAKDSGTFFVEKQKRTIHSEEIHALMIKYFPKQDAQSKAERAELMEKFFNTRSWTLISEGTESSILVAGLAKMRNHLEPPPNDTHEDVPL